MKYISWRVAIPILLTGASLEAQFQDRLYPFVELTDEMRDRIDLKDGSVDDWLEVLGEPTLTPLDFFTLPFGSGYDPSSFDFRVWLAWHHGGNHLFVAAEMVDDFAHKHSSDRFTIEPGLSGGDLTVVFGVDGDRSGGNLRIDNATGLAYPMQQAQEYTAFPGTYDDDNNVSLWPRAFHLNWLLQPPYADGGGAMIDSEPSFGVVEYYVTPFDNLIWDDKETSTVSSLFPDKTIGFCLQLADIDENKNEFGSIHGLYSSDEDDAWGENASDLWARGILTGAGGPEEGTAVNSVSWARIKASLSE